MHSEYIIFLLGAVLVTYLPRVIPLIVLSRMEIPDTVVSWLRYIPAAILAALLAPELFMKNGVLELSLKNINLLAAIPAFLVAVYKKNIFLTIITGVLSVAILQVLL
ncbi:MAG: AzlD domain-containing protein [Halanaerobiaceae bacterium]|nr:AzlD domain-containing protein [Halanaerobiaceae bacterium]